MNELRIRRSMSLATGLSALAQHSPEPTPEQRLAATLERALRDDPTLDLMQPQRLMVAYPLCHCCTLPARASTKRLPALNSFMGYLCTNCCADKAWEIAPKGDPKGDVVVHAQA